ncbi:unnamed protein product [Brugia timori]|uniref:Rad26/CSB-like winged helix DNA-binding domain-containing protein n=1 Tax=Brugia timori TaxID=42155 RepID=A0A0R3R0L5_9BILA|nr:unnamed protein product [Brugia timori]
MLQEFFTLSERIYEVKNVASREKKQNEVEQRKKLDTKVTFDDDDDVGDDTKAFIEENLSAEKVSELRELARKISRSIRKCAEARKSGAREKKSEKQRNKTDDESSDIKIPYLRKKRRYKQATNEFSGQDDYVLGKLLTNAGIISALQHDQIFAKGIVDEQLIEDEANVVAAKAAASLRRSRRMFSKQPFEKPRFGLRKAAGFQSAIENNYDDTEKPTFSGAALLNENNGINSGGSLLDAIRQRKQRMLDIQKTTDEEHLEEHYPSFFNPAEASDVKKEDKYDKLAEDIRLFMVRRKGQALTDEILQSFKNHISVEDSFAFRSILKRLCILQKNSNLWVLRDEYQ